MQGGLPAVPARSAGYPIYYPDARGGACEDCVVGSEEMTAYGRLCDVHATASGGSFGDDDEEEGS